MGYNGKIYSIPLAEAGLQYGRNSMLIPPHMMVKMRNLSQFEKGCGRRGGTSLLNVAISDFASGNGGFEEGDFIPGWTANNSTLGTVVADEDCSSLSGYAVNGEEAEAIVEVDPAGQFHMHIFNQSSADSVQFSKDWGSVNKSFTLEIRIKFDQLIGGSVLRGGVEISVGSTNKQIKLGFFSGGLEVRDSADVDQLISGSSAYIDSSWHTWKFVIFAEATVSIYRDDILIYSGIDCGSTYSESLVDGMIKFIGRNWEVTDEVSECHVDRYKISDPVRSGSYSSKLVASGAATNGAINDAFTIDPNVDYSVVLYYFITSYTAGTAEIEMVFNDGSVTTVDIVSATATTSGWTELIYTFGPNGTTNIPSDATTVTFQQKWTGGSAEGTFFIDDFSIPTSNSRVMGLHDFTLKSGAQFLVRATKDGKYWKSPAGILKSGLSVLDTESLNEIDFATHADWDTDGDFDDTGGNAAYTHSAGSGTLTQTISNLLKTIEAGKTYEYTYIISGYSGDPAGNITTGIASATTALTLSNGTHTVRFTANSNPGDFVISVTSSSGGVTFDDVTLKKVVARPVSIKTFAEKSYFANGANRIEEWDGGAAATVPQGGTQATDISFNADTGTIKFEANPAATDTITIHGTVWTFVAGAPGAEEIQIAANLPLTLDNMISELNGSADGNTAKATYTEDGTDTLTIIRDTKTDNDEFYINAAITEGALVTGLTKAATIKFGANPADADTMSLNGITFTFKDVPTDETVQIQIGATLAATLDNIIDNFADGNKGASHDEILLADYSEDGTDTLTITPTSTATGILYPAGAAVSGRVVTVSSIELYASLETTGDIDFVDRGFLDGQSIIVSGSTTSDGTYTVAGIPTTTKIILAAGESMTAEAAGDTVTITWGVPADWTGVNYPAFLLEHGRGNAARLWAFGCTDNPYRIYGSTSGGKVDFSDANGYTDDIETGDGYGVVGAVEYGDRLIAFGKNKAFIVNDTSSDSSDWYYTSAQWEGGVAHQRLIVKTDNDVLCMMENGHIYSVTTIAGQIYGDYKRGSLIHQVSMDRWIRENVDLDYIEDFHGEYDSTLRAVKWWIVRKGQTQSDTALVCFLGENSQIVRWTTHDNQDYDSGYSASCSVWYNNRICTGDHQGRVWTLEEVSRNDNGNAYWAGLKTNVLTFETNKNPPFEDKQLDLGWIGQEEIGSHSVKVNVWVDGTELTEQTVTCDAKYNSYEIKSTCREAEIQIYNDSVNEDFFLMGLFFALNYNGVRLE